MIFRRLKTIWNPELYHGWGKKNKFFEGWYYKIVSKEEDYAYAFIPGIAMDENGLKQAFIQILDGKKLKSNYIKFSFDKFKANPLDHDLRIGNNRFKSNSIKLDLPEIKGISKDEMKTVLKFLEVLEDNDDIQRIAFNVEIKDDEAETLIT